MFSLFGRKFFTDLIQLIGSMRSQFGVWRKKLCKLNLGGLILEFGSPYEKFKVWPRP